MNLTPSETTLPFKLSRRQLPIKLSIAIAINKAHGQSINNLGVYLHQLLYVALLLLFICTSHGLLYVALSRAGISQRTKVFITNIKDIEGTYENHIGKYTEM